MLSLTGLEFPRVFAIAGRVFLAAIRTSQSVSYARQPVGIVAVEPQAQLHPLGWLQPAASDCRHVPLSNLWAGNVLSVAGCTYVPNIAFLLVRAAAAARSQDAGPVGSREMIA